MTINNNPDSASNDGRNLLPWIIGGALVLLLIAVLGFFGLRAIVNRGDGATADSVKSGRIVLTSEGEYPKFTQDISHDEWTIRGTERLPENPIVADWLARLEDPAPEVWKTFPNIPNKDVPGFRVVKCTELDPNAPADALCVPWGMEYGTYSSPFCFSHPCDLQVGAWEYRYVSGDYSFLGEECQQDDRGGCILMLINVMDQSFTWRDQDVDNGFTLRGQYFDGDNLEWGVWGVISHGVANMLDMPTQSRPGEVLNARGPGNSGANCGSPLGCETVDVTVVVHAGDAIIARAHTVVERPTQ